MNMNNARTIYAQKTVEGRGAPRQMDDTSKIEGYMVNNGDGTYSKYLPDGTLIDTFKPNNDFIGGLSQNLNAIGDDRSNVGKFAATAAAMGYGANMLNGGIAGMEGAAAAEAGGAGGGLMGAESMAVPELATPSYGLSGGAGTFGSASAGSTGAAMGGATGLGGASTATGANTLAGLLGSKTGVLAAGGLLGALAGKDTTTTQSSSKDPWGPAQPYLLDNLKTNAAMQRYYQENPFSNEQKAAYQGVFNANANGMANAPVMSQIANNFMGSNRGRMAAMPSFIQGTQAAPINWDAYKNIGLLKG